MKILVDTSVLVRIAEANHPASESALEAAALLPELGLEACIVPQVIYEYWAVATRPNESNGLGLSPQEAAKDVNDFLAAFTLLDNEQGIYQHWFEIVRRHNVRGKSAHDARLVAAILCHGLTHILTLDEGDFSRYPEASVLTPSAVIARQI